MEENTNSVLQVLGRIEGKLDAEITLAREHRDDDKRRFTEVHKRLDDHEKDINHAKGQKSVILWLIGGGAAAIATAVTLAAKAFGVK